MPNQEHQALIESPERWPMRPLLPMKLISDDDIACGYMVEQRGLTIFDPDGSELASFDSATDLLGSGWRVD